MKELKQKLLEHIVFIYGENQASEIFEKVNTRLERFRRQYPELAGSSPEDRVSEKDSILITYGDMVQEDGIPPLQTLTAFAKKYLSGLISTIHILPFFPYSSDDGFSIIDYLQVNPEFGDWSHLTQLGEHFRLMFDAVVNHVSSQSVWFQGFLKGDPDFENYFTVIDSGTDLSRVFRPRATPVLTPFETEAGRKFVWTTFSADQIDLNFANPAVLLEVIDILLFYAAHGADFIRLDAVTFVWKEVGTSCVNSPHTHRIVQTIRTIFDIAAPRIAVITETNVPHKENIAYFGDGVNEAQMVYNFALPLLTLNAFHAADSRTLSDWAATLDLPSQQATFFNFLACHDGVGMLPVKDILDPAEITQAVERTQKSGGFVSVKSNEDGSKSPYELNINYLDALADPDRPETDLNTLADRFLASQSIMLALRGVPGIYFHSLFGSRNWEAGVEQTGRYRTINREKLSRETLEAALADSQSLPHKVFSGFAHMLEIRQTLPAFHPFGGQQIMAIDPALFALIRSSITGDSYTLCLTNITNQRQEIQISADKLPDQLGSTLVDRLSNQEFPMANDHLNLSISPYQILWLQVK